MRVIVNAAQEAGLSARCEPDTHSLLLGEFSKADCRRVFPKAISKAYKAGFEKVSQAADFIASPSCPLSPEEKQTLIQSQIDLLPIHQGDVTGLRIDICLENPETGETASGWTQLPCTQHVPVIRTKSSKQLQKEISPLRCLNCIGCLMCCSSIQVQRSSIVKPRKWKNIQGY